MSLRAFLLGLLSVLLSWVRSEPLLSFSPSADIIFGQSAAFTGEYAAIGQSVYDGLVSALSEWNSLPSTVANGPTLGILSHDDMYVAEAATANTNQLLLNDRVFALAGYVGDSASGAGSEIARQQNVPLLGSYAGSNELRSPFQRHVINIRASYFDETLALINYFVSSEHIARFSVFYENNSEGLAAFAGVKNALRSLRIQLFSSARFDRGLVNLTALLEDLISQSAQAPEAIILLGYSSTLAEFAKQARIEWPDVFFGALSFAGPTFTDALVRNSVTDKVFRTQVFDYKSSNPKLSNRYKSAMLARNASAVFNFASFEGYIVGRVISETVATVWSTLGSSVFNSNSSVAREAFLERIYNQGILHVDELRLGPYGDTSIGCENPGAGCGCNQGMRQIYGTRITTNGTFERHVELDSSFSMCSQVTPSFTLTFGQVAAFSGSGAELGQGLALGMRAAFVAANVAEELGLLKLELLTEDDQYNPVKTVAKTKELVDKQVFALVSNVGTGTTASILNYTTSQMIPLISPFTGATVFRKPFNKFVVNLRASYGDEIVAAVIFMNRRLGKNKFSIMYQDDAFGKSILVELDAALRAIGLNILSYGPFAFGTVPGIDVANAISKNSTNGTVVPEVIFLIGTAKPCSQFIVLARQLWPSCNFVATSVAGDQLGSLLQDEFNRGNVYITQVVPVPTDTGLPLVASYQKELKALQPNATFGVTSLEGYITGRFIIELLKNFPNTVSREKFVDALYPKRMFYFGGSMEFNFTEGCNQGARQVYLTKLSLQGTQDLTRDGIISFPDSCTISKPDCYPGLYRDADNERCQQCPKGWITNSSDPMKCIPCLPGQKSVYPNSEWPHTYFCIGCAGANFGECWNCEAGQNNNLTGASACAVCAPGQFTEGAGSTSCTSCGEGAEFNASSLQSNPSCNLCTPGTYALDGDIYCIDCPLGKIARDFGQGGCDTCPFSTKPNYLKTVCERADIADVFFVMEAIALTVLSLLLLVLVGLRVVPISNICLEGGEVILKTHWPHWVRNKNFGSSASVAKCQAYLRGTGIRHFEKKKLHTVEYRSTNTLAIRISNFEESELQTSMGCFRVPFPQTLWNLSPFGARFPIFFVLLFWLGLVVAPFCVLENVVWDARIIASIVSCALFVDALAVGWHVWGFNKTYYRFSLEFYSLKLRMGNANPSFCPRGPERAISAATLVTFYRTFADLIRSRNMYYINTCLIKPLTEPHQLSFAEIVGPVPVKWFVSHYWGTPFMHFVESLTLHSESQAARPRIGKVHATLTEHSREFVHQSALLDMTYWVCLFCNNQWRVADEIGSNVLDSSFCLALKSGYCRGTAMVLDPDALPLTRSWCLFEVLQTFSLTTENVGFEGLYLCTTTGVLNNGSAGVDVAMNMAKRITGLRLEDASASCHQDKLRIDDYARAMPGGFEAVNLFVRTVFRTALFAMRRRFQSDFADLVGMLGDSAKKLDLDEYLTRATFKDNPTLDLLRQASVALRAQTEGEELTRVRFHHSTTAPPGQLELRDQMVQSIQLSMRTSRRIRAIGASENEDAYSSEVAPRGAAVAQKPTLAPSEAPPRWDPSKGISV